MRCTKIATWCDELCASSSLYIFLFFLWCVSHVFLSIEDTERKKQKKKVQQRTPQSKVTHSKRKRGGGDTQHTHIHTYIQKKKRGHIKTMERTFACICVFGGSNSSCLPYTYKYIGKLNYEGKYCGGGGDCGGYRRRVQYVLVVKEKKRKKKKRIRQPELDGRTLMAPWCVRMLLLDGLSSSSLCHYDGFGAGWGEREVITTASVPPSHIHTPPGFISFCDDPE